MFCFEELAISFISMNNIYDRSKAKNLLTYHLYKIQVMIYRWTIQVQVKQCSVNLNSDSYYSLVMRVGNKFSQVTPQRKPHGNIVHFDSILKIQIDTKTNAPPENKISIMLNMINPVGPKTLQEEHIVAIASISNLQKIVAKNQKAGLETFKIYIFSQCLDRQAYIRACPKVRCQQMLANQVEAVEDNEMKNFSAKIKREMEMENCNDTNQKELLKELLQIQQKKSTELNKFISFLIKILQNNNENKIMIESMTNETNIQNSQAEQKESKVHIYIQQNLKQSISIKQNNNKQQQTSLLKQRNQLYQISEQLYRELKECKHERDVYLMELRQKELNFQHLKLELATYKQSLDEKKLQNEEQFRVLQPTPSKELTVMIQQNENLIKQNQLLNSKLRQLERKVKQCFKAIQQFKNDALSARSELIVKEREISTFKNGDISHKRTSSIESSPQKSDQNPKSSTLIEQLLNQISQRSKQIQKMTELLNTKIVTFSEQHKLTSSKIDLIKKETAKLFTNLVRNIKMFKDKEIILKHKVQYETNCEAILKNQ